MAGPAVHVAGAAIQLPPELIPLIGKILFFPLNYVTYDADENGEFTRIYLSIFTECSTKR